MTGDDARDVERELGSTLAALAPPPAPGLLDRAMTEVAATPQRKQLLAIPVDRAGWSRWLLIGGVAAAAMVVGIVIGSSRSLVTGDDPSTTPIPSAGPTGSAQASGSAPPMAWTEPAAYVFTFVSSCGERNLIGEFDVVVEDGIAIGYQPADERAASFSGGIEDIPTLGLLWARAMEASQDADAILTLETDATDGHPTLIDIDWRPNAIDDEECYRITSYLAYPPGLAWVEPESYTFTFNSECGLRLLNGRFEITVADGNAVAFVSPDGLPASMFDLSEMPTLADLASQVARAYADEDASVRAFEVDPEDGHPTRIDIDWVPNAVDDEECYTIESYTPGS